MDADRYQRVSEIFQAACERTAEDRRAYLDDACAGDDALRGEVERMLVADDPTSDFLEPAVDGRDRRAIDRGLARVGRYAIVEVLGRGGMGVVYRARQQVPERDVALKLIDAAATGPTAIRRFRNEAELLGRLQHPGIAQIFEAGTAEVVDESGEVVPDQPFLAMELIDGVPLTEFASGIDRRGRVRLLAEVCDAIQHAHQRGVVHLDLKPANLLVDATGRVKVLDFGVALALDADIERTLAGAGSVVGTLAYMGREQVAGDAESIDTRADIHALGAIGYELLTGRPPHDVRGTHLVDAIQIVLTGEPRPIEEIDPDIDPELAAVIDTAVRPEIEERYASVGDLAADLRRWLKREPVSVRPERWSRSARLFAMRHRPLVATAGFGAAALVAGVLSLGVGLVRANRAEQRASDRAEDARIARIDAETEAENLRAMAGFLEKIMFGVDPEIGGAELTFFEALDYTDERARRDLLDHPEVEAAVRNSLGTVYRRYSLYGKAEPHLRRALRLRKEHLGDEDVLTADSMVALSCLIFERTGRIDETLALIEQARSVFEAAEGPAVLRLAWLHLDRGLALLAADELVEAAASFERCVGILGERLGEGSVDVSRGVRNLAVVAMHDGRLDEAESLARRAVDLCEGAADDAYLTARARFALGAVLLERGRIEEAETVLAVVEAEFDRLVSAAHLRRSELDALLARLDLARGRPAAALAHAVACHRLRRELLAEGHWLRIEAELLLLRSRLAAADADGLDEALAALHRSADRLLGPDHRLTLEVVEARLEFARAFGDERMVETERSLLEALRRRRLERLHATGVEPGA